MLGGINHIPTTHVGSLPRPDELVNMLHDDDIGQPVDQEKLQDLVATTVDAVVFNQVQSGIDVVSDGETGKVNFATYVRRSLTGLAPGESDQKGDRLYSDLLEHPDFVAAERAMRGQRRNAVAPVCIGPIAYADMEPLQRSLTILRRSAGKHGAKAAFVPSISPGMLLRFIEDRYYDDEGKLLEALAEAMRREYEAIVAAGFHVQLDCPDLALNRHSKYRDLSDKAFLKIVGQHIDAFNHAVRNIPKESIRLHLCWGNYAGPHTHDVPLATIAPEVFRARAKIFSFEGANPRHQHEWEEFHDVAIPDDVVLAPGVIDSLTNFVEHPKLVAQRLCNWASVVGRDRIMASVDCGFSTFAESRRIAPSIVWAKFKAMREGADLAAKRLWGQ